jgi:hypothetical protein
VAPLFAALARIFPDAGELLENTAAARQFWGAALAAELAADPAKSEAERAAEGARAEARQAAFFDKYRDVLGAVGKRKRDLRRQLTSAASGLGLGAGSATSAQLLAAAGSFGGGAFGSQPTRSSAASVFDSPGGGGAASRKGSASVAAAAAGSPRSPPSLGPAAAFRDRAAGPKLSGSASEMAAAVASALLTRSRSCSGRGPSALGFPPPPPRHAPGGGSPEAGALRGEGSAEGRPTGSDLV